MSATLSSLLLKNIGLHHNNKNNRRPICFHECLNPRNKSNPHLRLRWWPPTGRSSSRTLFVRPWSPGCRRSTPAGIVRVGPLPQCTTIGSLRWAHCRPATARHHTKNEVYAKRNERTSVSRAVVSFHFDVHCGYSLDKSRVGEQLLHTLLTTKRIVNVLVVR